jgi:hypothetical protein
VVRVAQVAADDGPGGAGAFHRALFHGDSRCGQLCDDISDIVVDDQADVCASRRRAQCLGLELLAGLVKVDLAGPEGQRGAPGAEGHHVHAEGLGVERDGCLDACHRQHEMIKPVDPHRILSLS